jgi:pilus assembly protein CpaB
MRNLPPWVWLLMALVFGAIATFMALGWMRQTSQRLQPVEAPTVAVVVAAKDLEAANPLRTDQLTVVQWPQASAPKGGFGKVDEVSGRVAVLPMGPGEPILEAKLAPKGTPAGLTALVAPDKRAMTVKVDEASGIAGFIVPNNRVDVIVTISRQPFSEDAVCGVVLQNLRVLGTGQRIIEKQPDGKPQVVPTVTLEVSPEEGERLSLAQEGRISLALRGQKDERLVATSGVKTSTLLQGGRPEEPKPEEVSKTNASRVEVLRGLKRESVSF